MAFEKIRFFVPLLCLATLASTKPIMVSFGINEGPIIPRQPKTASTQQKTIVTRSPAPVSEDREDVPNPNNYKAPVPHQYRTELYSFKPPVDLALGTPLDQKYTADIDKVNQQRKEFARNLILGVDYTGPHTFEKQEYEILQAKKNRLAWKYNKPHYYQQLDNRIEEQAKTDNANAKYVPQIGVVYSAGVRYYVPQFVYYQPAVSEDADIENSVYDEGDTKYQH